MKLDSAFWIFKSADSKYRELADVINPDRSRYCDMHLSDMPEMVQIAHAQFDEHIAVSKQRDSHWSVCPADSISLLGSSRKSTTSARAKAAANKAAIQAKLNYLRIKKLCITNKLN